MPLNTSNNTINRLGKIVFSLLLIILMGGSQIQCSQGTSPMKQTDKVDFNFDVRPILVQNFYLCHGPDISSRKAKLRLDTFEGATAKRDGGKHAVVPGKSHKSELIKRITYEDPAMRMPPLESNLKLTQSQIEILKKWIDQGAEWKPHWAFIKPILEEPVKNESGLSSNEIDDFVLAKLESQNLKPAPQANKNTLIRRISYILTGLPPTAEKIPNQIITPIPHPRIANSLALLNSSALLFLALQRSNVPFAANEPANSSRIIISHNIAQIMIDDVTDGPICAGYDV